MTNAKTRETALNSKLQDAKGKAEASFKRKEVQAREGVKAMTDYRAAQSAEREKTARLKKLREAKETADKAAAQKPQGTRKKRP
jgi:hypothetical protein